MFKNFSNFFSTVEVKNNRSPSILSLDKIYSSANGFLEFFSLYEGMTFQKGLYRIHNIKEMPKWNGIVTEAFPNLIGRIYCFSYDWLGRQFSLDPSRIVDGQPQILLLEPGTGDALEIPYNFIDFHEKEMPQFPDACIAIEFFNEWLSLHPEGLKDNECAGYKTPLFLGGVDDVENLEKSDLDVYWSICARLIQG